MRLCQYKLVEANSHTGWPHSSLQDGVKASIEKLIALVDGKVAFESEGQ